MEDLAPQYHSSQGNGFFVVLVETQPFL
jgi:hypothetical protein